MNPQVKIYTVKCTEVDSHSSLKTSHKIGAAHKNKVKGIVEALEMSKKVKRKSSNSCQEPSYSCLTQNNATDENLSLTSPKSKIFKNEQVNFYLYS